MLYLILYGTHRKQENLQLQCYGHKLKNRIINSMYDHTYSKSMDQPGKVANPARGQLSRKKTLFSCLLFSRLRIWSRDTGSAVPSRVSLLISIHRLNLVLHRRDSSRVPRRRPFIYLKPPHAMESVPSLSGRAIAYRWRSLPRVAGTGPVNLKVVPNECCLGRSPWTN